MAGKRCTRAYTTAREGGAFNGYVLPYAEGRWREQPHGCPIDLLNSKRKALTGCGEGRKSKVPTVSTQTMDDKQGQTELGLFSPSVTSSFSSLLSMRSCACLYVSAARLAITDLVKRVDTTYTACSTVQYSNCGRGSQTHEIKNQIIIKIIKIIKIKMKIK
jgi:hypothetical protein